MVVIIGFEYLEAVQVKGYQSYAETLAVTPDRSVHSAILADFRIKENCKKMVVPNHTFNN